MSAKSKAEGSKDNRATPDAAGKKKQVPMVIVGHHFKVKEGLENFFSENPEYCILRTYPSYDYVRKGDFNLAAALVLICAPCNHAFMENPEKMFSGLKVIFPKARMVILNCDCEDEKKKELIRLGVKGFLPASMEKAALKKALGCILGGQIWISRELSQRLIGELLADAAPGIVYKKPFNAFRLTNREIEILQALASGLSNYAISEKLFLSEKTVKTHTHHIFRKMAVTTRTQAVMKAMELHII